MVRTATINDAEQLNILNVEFNGESDTSIDNIRAIPHRKVGAILPEVI